MYDKLGSADEAGVFESSCWQPYFDCWSATRPSSATIILRLPISSVWARRPSSSAAFPRSRDRRHRSAASIPHHGVSVIVNIHLASSFLFGYDGSGWDWPPS